MVTHPVNNKCRKHIKRALGDRVPLEKLLMKFSNDVLKVLTQAERQALLETDTFPAVPILAWYDRWPQELPSRAEEQPAPVTPVHGPEAQPAPEPTNQEEAAPPEDIDNVIACNICKMFLNGVDQYREHLKGKRHRKNNRRWEGGGNGA